MAIDWSPGEFVRYMAGNCDSECLLGKFDEDSLVNNAMEYLEKRTDWRKTELDGVRTMEQIPHPDLSGKRVDIGMQAGRGDDWMLFIEAKWVSKSRGLAVFFKEIVEDVFRLAMLKTGLADTAHRLLLVGGPEKYMLDLLNYENEAIRKLLHRPSVLHSWHFKEVDITTLPAAYNEALKDARKGIGKPLPRSIKTRLEGRATSKIGETKNDNPVHIRLWEIILVTDETFEPTM